MKSFLCEDFMLGGDTAKTLYHETAANIPIIDYHCHISPKEIAEDKKYKNIAEIWLNSGDHYKWRAIRAYGYDEKYVTGDASDREKFNAWAATLPACIGNPLYAWAHMELKRYFGYDGVLCPETADLVWELCNEKLAHMSSRQIMQSFGVKAICTTDDPADELGYHRAIAADESFDIAVLPAFRPDKGLHIEKPGFAGYINALSEASGIEIKDKNSLFDAYSKRLWYFVELGCNTADNGFEAVPFMREGQNATVSGALSKALMGESLSQNEIEAYKTELMLFLAEQYHKAGLVMQIHFGVARNNSSRLFGLYGPDAGADSIGGYTCIPQLSKLLGELDSRNVLPKTILYSVNPTDNAALVSLMGCFQRSDCGIAPGGAGKLQHGSAWWFNDNNLGMREQLTNLANNSLLANFVGMITDSRSFLSYTRHEYFRRILCDVVGGYVDSGEYPADFACLSGIISDVCFNNAKKYFGFYV